VNDAAQTPDFSAGEVGLVRFEDFHSNNPLVFDSGASIPQFTLRYETYGRLNKTRDNAILVCHALSGDHHCAGVHTFEDRKPGWWNNIIGPGKPIDTNRFFVVCSNCIGGCQGSTGPSSVDPLTGQAYHMNFPEITIRDMVRAQGALIFEHLGIEKLACVVGGSMGGMQALQWGIDFPDKVERVLALATTARQNAQAIAFNEVGRTAIMQDPDWNEGDYERSHGPAVGLSVARMMAHITYLSDAGLQRKFGKNRFEVAKYLHYQGRSFVNRFDANTYIYFTRALDRFDLYGQGGGELSQAFEPMQARSLIVGFTSDWLFPPEQNREIAYALLKAGKNATYAEIEMDYGHDSFLVSAPELYELVRAFLK